MKSSNLALIFLLVFLMTGCGGGGGGGVILIPRTLVSIAVTPAAPSIAQETTQQFTATGRFSDNSTQDLTATVTWTSSNTGVATIGAAGLVAAASPGTTTITATSGSISGSTTLTVTSATIVSIAVTPANPIVALGATEQFSATGTFSDNTTQNLTTLVTWSSSPTSVATISNAAGANGKATAAGTGTATITASFGGVSGSTTLTVPSGGGAPNVLAVTVNGSLCSPLTSANYPNKPCVSVSVCMPGTSTCQTINDIILDTGSFGLRIFRQAMTVSLPQVTVPGGNLAECAQFVSLALWGPVQTADVVLGGEPAVTVPVQVIDSTFGTVPAACGTPEASPSAAGLNGILGVGLFTEDCGAACVGSANIGVYYACSGTNCSGTTVPLASQVQNPVAHLPVDNNGVLVELPGVPPGGAPSVNGQLVLGIGTQANNTPPAVTAFPANPAGEFTTVFNGTSNTHSFIDTGSNGLFFSDPALPVCGGWFCPPTTTSLSATTVGFSGSPSGVVPFQIGNATSLFATGNMAFSELGGTLSGVGGFDWGLPFFYGRPVFVGIQGRSSSLGTGPFWAY